MESRMVPNLMQQVIDEFHGDTLGRVAAAIGETPAMTASAIRAVVPAALTGIGRKASNPTGAEELLDVIHIHKLDTSQFATASSALAAPDGVNMLISTGQRLGNTLFGSRAGAVTDWLASHAGMSRGSARSLLSLSLPMILSLVARRAAGAGGGVAGLMALMKGQNFLKDAPPGLENALGMGPATAEARERYEDVARSRAVYEREARQGSPWLKWAVPLALAAGLLWLLTSRDHRRDERTVAVRERVVIPAPTSPLPSVPTTPLPSVPTAPVTPGAPTAPLATAPNLGAMVDKKLPNGETLEVPTNGVESQLLAFIVDPNAKVSADRSFSFDRIEFERGSARLGASSHEQLQNIATILKAYPNVSVKIGGYADSNGDAAQSKKLSADRATATMNELAKLGVPRSRMQSEGHGSDHTSAGRPTGAGGQRNGRVDIRVTKK